MQLTGLLGDAARIPEPADRSFFNKGQLHPPHCTAAKLEATRALPSCDIKSAYKSAGSNCVDEDSLLNHVLIVAYADRCKVSERKHAHMTDSEANPAHSKIIVTLWLPILSAKAQERAYLACLLMHYCLVCQPVGLESNPRQGCKIRRALNIAVVPIESY